MVKTLTVFAFMLFALQNPVHAQTQINAIPPVGIFKEIDVARHNRAIDLLSQGSKKERKLMLDSVLENPDFYNPPVLYAVSHELYQLKRMDEAAYYFYLAQLKARIDANICADKTATQKVSILNSEYGPDINQFAMADLVMLEKTITEVIAHVKSHADNYDRRWLNLHGMWAVQASLDNNFEIKELSQPAKDWADIKTKTINDYYSGFQNMLKSKEK